MKRSPIKRTAALKRGPGFKTNRRKPRNSERGPWRSAAYIAWVGWKLCCIPDCGKLSGPPHHLLRVEGKCAGRRSGDDKALPMCHEHHHALHMDGNETRFMAEHGIDDAPALAMEQYEMWKESAHG